MAEVFFLTSGSNDPIDTLDQSIISGNNAYGNGGGLYI